MLRWRGSDDLLRRNRGRRRGDRGRRCGNRGRSCCGGGGGCLYSFYRGDETVAAARKRFDVARIFVGVAERAAQSLDRGVHAVFEIHEGVGGPEAFLQFLAGEEFAGLFEEKREDLEGAAGEADLAAVFAQLAGAEINLIGVEAKPIHRRNLIAHVGSWEQECTPRGCGTQDGGAE